MVPTDVTSLGALFGIAIALCAFVWLTAVTGKLTEQTPEPVHDHRRIHGDATKTKTIKEAIEDGLSWEKAGGIFIAAVQAKVRNVWLRWQKATSVLLLAAPGVGKGVCCIIPSLLDRTRTEGIESIWCFDPAGENFPIAAPYLESIGYRIVYSNPSGIKHKEFCHRFGAPTQVNRLGNIDIEAPTAEEDIREDAAILVTVRESDNSPHFAESAQDLTASVAVYLRYTEGTAASWPRVAEIIHESPAKLNQLFGKMIACDAFPSVQATGRTWYCEIDDKGKMQMPTDGMRDVFTSAKRNLKFLLMKPYRQMFGASMFNPADMRKHRTAYFHLMPKKESEGVKKANYLAMVDAKDAFVATETGLPVLFILDEMCAALPRECAKLVQSMPDLLRKYGVKLLAVCQGWSQFAQWSGDRAHAIRGSMGAVIYYGANDTESINEVIAEGGTYTAWNPTTDIEAAFGVQGGVSPVPVKLFTPEDVRGMINEQEQVCFLMGSRRACVLRRTPYMDIPELRRRAAVNRFVNAGTT